MKNHIDLNRAIIRGQANGKVLWQPRIICWYSDRQFTGYASARAIYGNEPSGVV